MYYEAVIHFPACKLLERGIVALYGPRNTAISKALLSLANRFGVPYVETQWDVSPTPDAYALSMYPKVDTFGEGLYEYLTRVEKWRHITIIHEQPESKFLSSFNGQKSAVFHCVRLLGKITPDSLANAFAFFHCIQMDRIAFFPH